MESDIGGYGKYAYMSKEIRIYRPVKKEEECSTQINIELNGIKIRTVATVWAQRIKRMGNN